MNRHLAWLGAAVPAVGCPGDDAPVDGDGSSSTGAIVDDTSTGVSDLATGGSAGSSDGSTGTPTGTSTGLDPETTTGEPPVFCGDGMIGRSELCDGADVGAVDCVSEGFDSGTLACNGTCDGYDTRGCGTCGNIVVDGDEVCDAIVLLGQTCQTQGYDSGTLGCAADCLSYVVDGCGTCGNDVIDGAEICDGLDDAGASCPSLGFDSGTLGACDPDCMGFDTAGCGTCGNAMLDGDELCDGADLGGQTCIGQGFDNGDLACDPGCGALDTSGCGVCGNGVIDGSESCDGMLLGGQSCASLGLLGGTLACAVNCQYDFPGCDLPGIPFGSDSGYSGYALTPPMTSCDDISATGTATMLTDDSNVVVPIGFTFPVYGLPYTDANIESNGTLRFGDALYLTYNNTCLPTATAPSTNTLYVFWDDLDPAAAGEVYYQTLGMPGDQRFVVQWDVPNYAGDTLDLMRFQAMLHEATGQIEVCYVDTINAGNVGDSGAQATAGIQHSSMDALQYSCSTPDLVDGLRLLYVPI